MKTSMTPIKKWLIGVTIAAIIVLLIIWYRNVQKRKAEEEALAKLKINPNYKNTNATIITNDTGKNAIILSPAGLYSSDGNFTLTVTRSDIGGLLGKIIADQTDSGSLAFYKIQNAVGSIFYVAKFAIKPQ